MATNSTAPTSQSGTILPRSRPLRALPIPSLTPIVSEDEKNLIPVATNSASFGGLGGNQEDVRWRDPYQRHPPSPPVREKDFFHDQQRKLEGTLN